MSLYWSADDGLAADPADPADDAASPPGRLHALVIGVGTYDHLEDGTGTLAPILTDLSQLTTSRLSAIRIARWLVESYSNPECPLGSVELLLSDAGDVALPDGTTVAVEKATMAAIKAAALRWDTRCGTAKENTSFFYFAGHGVNAAGYKQLLLPADFGAHKRTLWDNCIHFEGLRTGMRANAADTQLFFIDACNELHLDLAESLDVDGDSLLSGAKTYDTVTSAGTYRAASLGQTAYGPDDDITFFAQALLETLDGVDAHAPKGRPLHDNYSLGRPLSMIMEDLGRIHRRPLRPAPHPDGARAVFHYPASILVRTSVTCASLAASQAAAFAWERDGVLHESPAGEPRPWTHLLPRGPWTIRARLADGQVKEDQTELSPPTTHITF
ncbi:MAG: caspase family protein [Bacteroidota bacterium]